MKFGPAPAGIRTGAAINWINRDFLKHTATARQKLQRRAAREIQRQDRDPAFGDNRILLHLSSRDGGLAEGCKMIRACMSGRGCAPVSLVSNCWQ
jgi:hypothetical protein